MRTERAKRFQHLIALGYDLSVELETVFVVDGLWLTVQVNVTLSIRSILIDIFFPLDYVVVDVLLAWLGLSVLKRQFLNWRYDVKGLPIDGSMMDLLNSWLQAAAALHGRCLLMVGLCWVR